MLISRVTDSRHAAYVAVCALCEVGPPGKQAQNAMRRGQETDGIEFMHYRLLTLRGRPVCALPATANVGVKRAAVRRILAFTIKRRAVQVGLAAAVSARIDMALARPPLPMEQLPHLAGVTTALERIANYQPWDYICVYWPSEPERGRAYLHLLDATGAAVGFLKWAARDDAASLRREQVALGMLSGNSGTSVRVPKLVAADTNPTQGPVWLLTEPLPIDAEALSASLTNYPHDAIDALLGGSRHVMHNELHQLTWWAELQAVLPSCPASFRRDLDRALHGGVEVGRVHGDFGAHNICRSGSALWVFDWEESAPDGPTGSDYWSFEFLRRSAANVFRSATLQGPSATQGALLTVAFQLARGIRSAPETVSRWDDIRKGAVV